MFESVWRTKPSRLSHAFTRSHLLWILRCPLMLCAWFACFCRRACFRRRRALPRPPPRRWRSRRALPPWPLCWNGLSTSWYQPKKNPLNIVERRYWKSLKCLEMIHINIFKQLRWLIQTMDCLLPSSSICLGVICATTMSNIVTLRLFSCFFVTTFAILGCSCCMLLLARGSFLSKTSQPPKCRAFSTVWQRGSSNDSNSSCIYCQATAKLLPVQAKLLVIVNMHTKNKDGGNWGPG